MNFIPKRIFDFHAHLYRLEDTGMESDIKGIEESSIHDYLQWRQTLESHFKSDSIKGGLFFPYTSKECDEVLANEWLIKDLKKYPDSKALLLVKPNSDRDKFQEWLSSDQVVGFKPYHVYSSRNNTFDSDILEFVPEWIWEMAHRSHGIIMLHLVKRNALADKDNQRNLYDLCSRYNQAKVILAHAARGFNSQHTELGIRHLKGLNNVFFDSSAICEPMAFISILKHFGPHRLLFGTDFPICNMIGKCVSVGNDFFWLSEKNFQQVSRVPCEPASVLLESINALQIACNTVGLNKKDIENIFYGNVKELFRATVKSNETQELYEEAKRIIPTGTQLLSKNPDKYAPGQWPAYFREARGCETWDLDGKHFIDFSTNGIGTCLLGFNDEDVNQSVIRRIHMGNMCTLNPPEEVELAHELCQIHPWAEQVRFARTGGEVASVAIRIARSTTKKEQIAVSGYHGWHDWYLAVNHHNQTSLDNHLIPGVGADGVPNSLKGTCFSWELNSIEEFDNLIATKGDELAAVIMEPCRFELPDKTYLNHIRQRTEEKGILLIIDEITSGWRMTYGGAHLLFDLKPDIAIFGKALGNGYPIAAVIGTKDAMKGAHDSFISSTYWTESIGPVAALKTLEKLKKTNAHKEVNKTGKLLCEIWKKAAKSASLDILVKDEIPSLAHFSFKHELSDAIKTYYTQFMLEKGYLAATSFYPTLAHHQSHLNKFESLTFDAFQNIKKLLEQGLLFDELKGDVSEIHFRRT